MAARKDHKKHPVKGDYGYYSYEKKRRGAIVAFLFGVCMLVFFTGLIMTGTRKNLFTLIAILGVLPAAKWAVSLIMVFLQKPIDPKVYETTEKIAADLTRGYELCVTAYEARISLDAVVVCGNSIAAFSSTAKDKIEFMETHMRKIIHGNGLGNPALKIGKPFLFGLIASLAVSMLFVMAFSLVFVVMKSIVTSAVIPLSVVALMLGCFAGGWVCGSISRSRGLFYGLAVGLTVFIGAWIIGIAMGEDTFSLTATARLNVSALPWR